MLRNIHLYIYMLVYVYVNGCIQIKTENQNKAKINQTSKKTRENIGKHTHKKELKGGDNAVLR